MNMTIIEEIIESMHEKQNNGINDQQKEAYMQISGEMNVMFQDMQNQQSKLKKMANIFDEAGNSMLAEQFQMLAVKMNSELEAMYEMIETANCAANQ